MKINDEVYIHGYVDEIRKDTIIIRNDGGYFGTVKNETKPKADITDRLLDCIMADIRKLSPEPTAEDVIDGNQIKDAIWEILLEVLQIIDEYKESEG